MTRWSRPIGIAISFLVLAGLIAIALWGGSAPPDADLRNGRIFIQDNLWSSGERQYAVWVTPDGTPYAGSHAATRAATGEW